MTEKEQSMAFLAALVMAALFAGVLKLTDVVGDWWQLAGILGGATLVLWLLIKLAQYGGGNTDAESFVAFLGESIGDVLGGTDGSDGGSWGDSGDSGSGGGDGGSSS